MASTLITTRWPYDANETTLAGTYDGVNTVFTITWEAVNGTLRVVQSPDGLALTEGIDYTRSGKTLTLVTAPPSGGNLQASYITNG